MNDKDFDSYVTDLSTQLDAEAATQPHTFGAAPKGVTIGSLFSQVMRGIRAGYGAFPWSKFIVIAAIVITDIKAGKDVAQIIADVIAALQSGKI